MTDDAPAVLGFAESMEQFCNQRNGATVTNGKWQGLREACRGANLNLLRIGDWNMCVTHHTRSDPPASSHPLLVAP